MDKAGYTLIKCKTNDDVQSFKHYWKRDEELCTFRDPHRIKTHTIFFAVKKNVEDIKRENFTNPRRQDEYGTSVISIQFTKGDSSTVSIKNRYNHTVSNPDATFSNDLENIYPGLTESFTKYYGINFVHKGRAFELPGYVLANDGRYYKYNYEIDNVYFCPNNIVIRNGQVTQYDKSRYEIIDYFIFDKVEKKIITRDISYHDSLVDAFNKESNQKESIIKKMEIINKENEHRLIKIITIEDKLIEITIDKFNRIIGYSNENITKIGNDFLNCNNSLTELNLPALTTVRYGFLHDNNSLTEFNAPNLKDVPQYILDLLNNNKGNTLT